LNLHTFLLHGPSRPYFEIFGEVLLGPPILFHDAVLFMVFPSYFVIIIPLNKPVLGRQSSEKRTQLNY
jgi:hypothetical protein